MSAPLLKYGLEWQPGTSALDVELDMIRMYSTHPDTFARRGQGLFHHYRAAMSAAWPEDDHHRWSDLILKTYLDERIIVITGPRDCVSGDTRILNPITGEQPTIAELSEQQVAPLVMTINGPEPAGVPFLKGEAELFEVTCANGASFKATKRHFGSTPRGFVAVEFLSPGQAIHSVWPASPASSAAPGLSVHVANGRRCSETASNFRGRCGQAGGPYGAQLRWAASSGPKPSPLRADVPRHTRWNWQRDVPGKEFAHSPVGFFFGRHSSGRYVSRRGCMADEKFPPWPGIASAARDSSPRLWRWFLGSGFQPATFPKSNLDDDPRVQSWGQYTVRETIVQSIKPIGRGFFYDLEVPRSHHYFAEGFIHHNSSKTRTISKIGLLDYWAFPEDTLILMTSTTVQGLELRVWGDIKNLFRRARERFPDLPGNVVDAKHGLFTDDLSKDKDNEDIRVMNKGIIGIPMISSQNEYQGMVLKNFAGIKQRRRRLFGDELQFISSDYLKVIDSLDKGDFKAGLLGNPIASNGKALDKVSEPKDGWGSQGEITKTMTWRNKYNGVTVALCGLDSPNFDPETLNRYDYLISQSDVDRVSARPGGKDSAEWWSLIMGIRKAGVISDRVLTVEMIESCGGFGDCIWSQEPSLKVYGVDAGFGGDPCVATYLECGTEVGGVEVMVFAEQFVIPITLSGGTTAEDQIAYRVKADCARFGVPASNIFVECGMRATLAVAMGRIIDPAINAINFGGPATERPVSNDMFVFDEKTKQRRLKTAYGHYSKLVTEFAFAVRQVVESKQARRFPRLAAEEFQRRETRFVYGDRHELETKAEYKLRNGGESPNFSDSCMIAVEGARRLGFVIQRINVPAQHDGEQDRWLEKELDKHRALVRKTSLSYA